MVSVSKGTAKWFCRRRCEGAGRVFIIGGDMQNGSSLKLFQQRFGEGGGGVAGLAPVSLVNLQHLLWNPQNRKQELLWYRVMVFFWDRNAAQRPPGTAEQLLGLCVLLQQQLRARRSLRYPALCRAECGLDAARL